MTVIHRIGYLGAGVRGMVCISVLLLCTVCRFLGAQTIPQSNIPQPPPNLDPLGSSASRLNDIPQVPSDTVRPQADEPHLVLPFNQTVIVPATQFVYVAALRVTAIVPIDSTIVGWRRDAADALECMRVNNYQLVLQGLGSILTYDGTPLGASSSAEDLSSDVKDCVGRYLDDVGKIMEASGARDEAKRWRAQHLANLRIDQSGSYAVNTSKTTAHIPTDEPETRCHDETSYPIKSVPVTVGFDAQGNPRKEMRLDVVKRTRRVCD